MPTYYTTLALISGFVYIFGLVSLFVKQKLFLGESFIAVIFGLIIKQFLNDYLKTIDKATIMIQLSRIVISLQVVAVGISVPKSYIGKEKVSLFMLLVPMMICTYFASAVFARLVLRLSWRLSFVIAACVTPTDPVLAAAIMKGKFADKYIPVHLRNLLVIESGANDGLGYLLLMIPMLGHSLSVRKFLLETILCEIILACFLGALIGYIARKMLVFSRKRNLIDKESFLVSVIALGLFVTGICAQLEYDDILACFVCGLVFSSESSFIPEIRESHLMETIDAVFNHCFFILFGAFFEWNVTREYVLCAVIIIFFRRLPFFVIFQKAVPQLMDTREVLFAGWFGPIGVGAIFFAYHATHYIEDLPDYEQVLSFVKTCILCSIFIHGVTVPVLHFTLKGRKHREEIVTESNCLVDEENMEENNDSFEECD